MDKGFRVVGVEANPRFCTAARQTFDREIANGQFFLVDRALATEADSDVVFFVRDDCDGWSSLFHETAERDGQPSQIIKVVSTTVSGLFDHYGVPYYVKCDIEGGDRLFVEQLIAEQQRPHLCRWSWTHWSWRDCWPELDTTDFKSLTSRVLGITGPLVHRVRGVSLMSLSMER